MYPVHSKRKIDRELAYNSAQERKLSTKLKLATAAEQEGYSVHLITLEVGSQGVVSTNGFIGFCDTFHAC